MNEISSSAELEPQLCKKEKTDTEKKSLYEKSDTEIRCDNNDKYDTIGGGNKKYRYSYNCIYNNFAIKMS